MKSLHELCLEALASAAVADTGADTAIESRKTLREGMFQVAKTCGAEKPFNENIDWLYQHLTTAEGALWAQAHNVILVASKRKDFPYKLPQSFLNVVSVLRGALKRDLLKGSYQATRTAKQQATKDETDKKRMKRVQDETLPIEQRHLAAEGLAGRRRDEAIKAIREAFDKADVTGKEHIATELENLAKSLVKASKPEVTMPQGEANVPHAARRNRKAG